MTNTNQATVEKKYIIKISSGSDGAIVQDSNTHTQSEIIDRAKEVLAKETGLDLSDYADLEQKMKNEGEEDVAYYVDKSGNPVEFTEEMQFTAAIAALNSKEQHFEAIPVR